MIEWVVKIGGSLFPEDAIEVAKTLKGTNSLIIIGGGEFANLIRKYDNLLNLSSEVTHKTAIDSMDILAKLVNDKVDSSKIANSINEAKQFANEGFNPILLTSNILNEYDPFESSWDVTLYMPHTIFSFPI